MKQEILIQLITPQAMYVLKYVDVCLKVEL